MAGKYTEFEKQAKSLRIVLLPDTREDVQAIAKPSLTPIASWQR